MTKLVPLILLSSLCLFLGGCTADWKLAFINATGSDIVVSFSDRGPAATMAPLSLRKVRFPHWTEEQFRSRQLEVRDMRGRTVFAGNLSALMRAHPGREYPNAYFLITAGGVDPISETPQH